ARLSEANRELVKVTDALYRLPLTDENVCVFLGDDRRCMVEAHEGLSLKPEECQRFPFAAVRLPDGTAAHDTSASCKRIAETLLLAFQPILPRDADEGQVLARDEKAGDIERLPPRIYRGVFRRATLADYQLYLARLKAI